MTQTLVETSEFQWISYVLKQRMKLLQASKFVRFPLIMCYVSVFCFVNLLGSHIKPSGNRPF